ncbi:MAG: Wzz/FepE/Etk N-terminal domain-containing protein, partial [Verrucomicrobiales bacterium]
MDYEKLNSIAESEISDGSSIARGLKDYIFWVRNKLWLVILLTVVGIVLGIFVHVKSPPIYLASVSIEVERVERGDSLDGMQGSNYRTEAFLGGDAIINTVTQKLLVPEILTAMVEASEPKLYEREDIIKLNFRKNLRSTEESVALQPEQLVNMMLGEGWIRAVPRKKSYIVDIYVEHTSAEVAHQIANGILEASKKNVENKMNEETSANVSLANQMVSGAEKEILELGERLSLYNACFLRKALIDKAEEDVVELKKRYGPKWPALIEAENKLKSHKETFDTELKQVSIISPVEKDYWDNLPQEIDTVINVQNRGQFITAELKSKEDLRNSLLSKIDSLVVSNKSSREFSVTKKSILPKYPIGPSFVKTFGLFFVGALASGIGLAILMGFLDPSVRTVAELEEYTGFPVLGAIPQSQK